MQPKDVHRSCLVKVDPPSDTPFSNLTSIGGVLFLGTGDLLEHPGSERRFTRDEVERTQRAWKKVNLKFRKGSTEVQKGYGWRKEVLEAAGKKTERDPTLADPGRTKFYLSRNITYGDFMKAVSWVNHGCGYVMYSFRAPSIGVRTWDEGAAEEELKFLKVKIRKKVRFK